jgi:hypothetical protein
MNAQFVEEKSKKVIQHHFPRLKRRLLRKTLPHSSLTPSGSARRGVFFASRQNPTLAGCERRYSFDKLALNLLQYRAARAPASG